MTPLSNTRNESTRHLKALFDNAAMGIVVADSRGEITAINSFASKEFGYTKKELIGQKVELLIPSRFMGKHKLYHKKFKFKPQTRLMGKGLDLFAVKKNGVEFPVEISFSNYTCNREKYIICFINNITIRKKTEKIIEKLHDELESTVEQRTCDLKNAMERVEKTNITLDNVISYQKAILDNAGAMIIATDSNGIIKLFNPEAALNTGYTESELVNKKKPVLFHDSNEIARVKKNLLKEFEITINEDFEALVEKSRRNIHAEEQYTYIRKNGTTFPVSLTITAIRDTDGMIIGYMGIAIDISARKKAEEKLKISLEKEKGLSKLKSGFISMASHEFRTPLSTILSSAYLIEKYTSTEDQPKRETHLQRIISSVTILTDILNDFLSVGKVEEGKIQVRPASFNIPELVKTLIGELQYNLKKQQKIYYRHKGPEEVYMDPSLLKHIIMNLLSNASKFSAEATQIEIKTSCDPDHMVFTVKDYGIGIPAEDQQHLMERFFRGANAVNIQGTGLGLHIVAKYAELMNGKVSYETELNKGTEFKITFILKKGQL